MKEATSTKELKGKQAKIAKSKAAKKAKAEVESVETATSGKYMNYGKCCTCVHYPYHKRHEAQPCKVSKKYVARKRDACPSYKCKYN